MSIKIPEVLRPHYPEPNIFCVQNYPGNIFGINEKISLKWNPAFKEWYYEDCSFTALESWFRKFPHLFLFHDSIFPPAPHPEPSEQSQGGKTLGQMLKEARTERRTSVKNVLEATGVSNEYLRKLEADELKSPSASVLWKLSQYYGIDLKPLAIKAGIIIKAPPSPNDINETTQAIRETNERLNSEGPDASLKFLQDAGIVEEEPDVNPDRAEALRKILEGDPTISELVEKSLALGVAPVIKYQDVRTAVKPERETDKEKTQRIIGDAFTALSQQSPTAGEGEIPVIDIDDLSKLLFQEIYDGRGSNQKWERVQKAAKSVMKAYYKNPITSEKDREIESLKGEAGEFRQMLTEVKSFFESRRYAAYAEDVAGLLAKYPTTKPSNNDI